MHFHSEVTPGFTDMAFTVVLSTRGSLLAGKKRLSRAITMVQVRSLETAEVTNGEHITVRSEPS